MLDATEFALVLVDDLDADLGFDADLDLDLDLG
jgi:hypothetical protein